MATASGKTMPAVTALYRFIKFGGARRVLFLVDRSNLVPARTTATRLASAPAEKTAFATGC